MSDADSELLICRCEEVTKEEVLEAIEAGARTLWQVRRRTRLGMGLCQGRSCQRLAARIIADVLQTPIEEVLTPSYRPPVRPASLEALCSGEYLDLETH
ncbi:(2Fe-2S)-binding protein [Chloroflexota bacterium]